MSLRISKYEFDSQAQFKSKFDALHTEDSEGNLIPDFRFAAVELGHIVLEQGEYDEEGEEITAPVLSENYHVDMAWWEDGITTIEEEAILDENGMIITPEVTSIDHPYGWKTYAIDLEEGQGMHSFAGVDYQSHKM